MDDLEMMQEMKTQGFVCSQIIVKMGLDLLGKENPDLVKAMHSLAGGIGYTGEVCGTLTAGACLLGMYAGKGSPEDEDDPRLIFMVEDLVNWFKQEFGQKFGGIRCVDLVHDDSKKMSTVCPEIMTATYQKVKDLLVENGFDLSWNEK